MLIKDIAELLLTEIKQRSTLVLAIDGRCAAGKTTLAAHLAELCDCNVIHMDHFFLPWKQNTMERSQQAGENMDYVRFRFSYRPFNCHKQEMGKPILVFPKNVTIVEGSYSCHPVLKNYYDLSVFLDAEAKKQIQRIRLRNGEDGVLMFQERWIPMENTYFHSFRIQEKCDLYFKT
ncbi:uridine kinase family protein [Mediterraneibacter agrestimuris]|uniref:uridine kinase family protein n=1 Tax=Mediterraneibacter agrestimuris TaxID=2941333 RepID=UPI0020408BEE|nr:uridine kinase [Mediterraneibacter agrestimuris]